MPSLEEHAAVRVAALRAEHQLERLHAVMTLLYLQMAEVAPPVPEEVERWGRVIEWLSDVVADLQINLDQSLRHDELTAADKRRGSSS